MRHRLINAKTGLGNPGSVILDNTGKLNKRFCKNVLEQYFKKDGYFDFKICKSYIAVGIEPAYQYERLKIIYIHRQKKKSCIQTGRAWGSYGSMIGKTTKFYFEYRRACKFTRFINEWHAELFGKYKK